MNTCGGRAKFRNFRNIFDSENSSTIVMIKLTTKLEQKISPKITMWENEAGNFTTSQKVNIYDVYQNLVQPK